MTLLLIYFVYIVLWVALVYLSYRIALKLSQSKKIAVAASLVAFLVMYWPAFGDLIPTLYTHKQLCEKEAGFKIFVTPEQWAAENPGVLETLVPYGQEEKNKKSSVENARFISFFEIETVSKYPIRKITSNLIDKQTNKIIFKHTDFQHGYENAPGKQGMQYLKIWLEENSCFKQSDLIKSVKDRRNILTYLKMMPEGY